MHFTPFVLLASAAAVQALPALDLLSLVDTKSGSKNTPSILFHSPVPFKASSEIRTLTEFLTLKKTSKSKSSSPAGTHGHSKHYGGTAVLTSRANSEVFTTEITLGDQTFEMVIDTGSSDTFAFEHGFTCLDANNGTVQPVKSCGDPITYTRDGTFSQIPDVVFNTSFRSGQYLNGIFGYENVTLANVTVNSTVALVNYAAWNVNGAPGLSGLIGLGYPNLTSIWEGNDAANATKPGPAYDPIFTTMYKEGLIDPYFSVVIERDISGPAGYLTFGGIPPVECDPHFTSTPLTLFQYKELPGKTFSGLWYTININSINLDGKPLSGSGGDIQYMVDTGTTLTYVPTDVVEKIWAGYTPAPYHDDWAGFHVVDCDAKTPELAIEIGGTKFPINPQDAIFIVKTWQNGSDLCVPGFVDGGSSSDIYVLGNTFLKNVVTVFDIGAAEMKFSSREFYENNNPIHG